MKIKLFYFLRGCVTFLFLFIMLGLSAQETAIYDNPEANYQLGLELFNKEKYGAAQNAFDKVIGSVKEDESELKTNAEYYSAICALELFNNDAEYQLTRFIDEHPASARIGRAYFQLGRLQFRNKDYRKALVSFGEVNRFDLSREERIEYAFKTGFCRLNKKDLTNAKKMFAQVKDGRNKYSDPATYYYAHIEYEEGDYEEALKGFDKLKNSRSFKNIIPYYILHIYYYQGQYDKILENGPALYENANSKRKSEIARIIGDAYYRYGDFENALKYLEDYKRSTRRGISREDNYQIAYAYFKTGRFNDAIKHFQNVISVQDSLSQNAFYHLAGCYLETDQKKYAANAFLSANKSDFDKKIKEDALFNYAKLSVEVAHDPYNESIKYLEKYINDYPNSDRRDEAYNLMVQLFLSTKNFKAALESIEKIKDNSTSLKKAYQKITFYRGIELFNNREFKKAIDLFKTATAYNYDSKISAEANYWIAESFHRLNNNWGAMKYYNEFLRSKGASAMPLYNRAFYNLGYTYYARNDYSDAVDNFKKFITRAKNENVKLVNDAYLRLGDSYFINKKYETAIDYYNEAIKLNVADVDYALYQKAMSYGALGKFREKINTLDRINKQYRKSPYADDALYEMGTSNLIMNDNRNALVYFDRLVRDYPRSQLARKSLLKSGLIYYNNDQNQKAISTLKQVAEKYPNTAEAREALASLKNIYIDMNQVNEFFDYSKDLPFAEISTSEQDSITYIAAENQYMNNNCDGALPSFASYIQSFPSGAFLINAHYYKADCELRNNAKVKALEDLEYVVEQPMNTFTENALLKASNISYELKMYDNAWKHYNALENLAENNTNINIALEGQMNSSFYTQEHEKVIEAAKKLLKNEKVTNEQALRAHYVLGKSYFAQNQFDEAKMEYSIVDKLTTNELGAESKYYQAYIDFDKGDYTQAEETIFKLVDDYGSYDYWVAKSFILLADIYVELDNIFQAKQTLQSIIENYQGDDLKIVAQLRLKQITDTEAEEQQVVEEEEGM